MTDQSTERPDLLQNVQAFLPRGIHIRQIFICQTAPYFWLFVINYLTLLTIFWVDYRCVVIADEGIYVLKSTKTSGGSKPKALVGMIPRQTKLGPVSGTWGQIMLFGKRHWVHKRFHHLIETADKDAGLA